MSNRKIRVGIDVGGTHTKAVAIDDATYEIIGIGSVKTTHDSKPGVSEGVVESFKKCLEDNNKYLFANQYNVKLWRLGPYTHKSHLISLLIFIYLCDFLLNNL